MTRPYDALPHLSTYPNRLLPCAVLGRPADPDLAAGAALWTLYSETPASLDMRLRATAARIASLTPKGTAAAILPLGADLGAAGPGAALLLCQDRSCLVLRNTGRQGWTGPLTPDQKVDILPIVLRLPDAISTGDCWLAIRPRPESPTPEITVSAWEKPGAGEDAGAQAEQRFRAALAGEAAAWAHLIDRLPGPSRTGQDGQQPVWPAAFPVDEVGAARRAALCAHLEDAGQFLLITQAKEICGAYLRITSGKRLQGGVEMARLNAQFHIPEGRTLSARRHDALAAQLEALVFHPRFGFTADTLVAQTVREARDFSIDRVLLASTTLAERPSNHEMIRIMGRFRGLL